MLKILMEMSFYTISKKIAQHNPFKDFRINFWCIYCNVRQTMYFHVKSINIVWIIDGNFFPDSKLIKIFISLKIDVENITTEKRFFFSVRELWRNKQFFELLKKNSRLSWLIMVLAVFCWNLYFSFASCVTIEKMVQLYLGYFIHF